jgi:predicted RNA binding protein YcfA (HicA-like mRNA interferase family)
MGKQEKLIQKILSGRQDQSIGFHELVSLLLSLGFSGRTNGSHHIFYKENITEIINIQPDGSKAKPYQVRQIREIIVKYKLEEEDD